MMTLRQAHHQGTCAIRNAGVSQSDTLDALLLLCRAAGISKERFYCEPNSPVDSSIQTAYDHLITRCCAGEPIAYILGEREFYGRVFTVDQRVLIPRPDTEILVEQALKLCGKDEPLKVLDLCTGSGCIGITLAAEIVGSEVTLADLSEDALTVARTNCQTLLGRELETVQGNLFESLPNRRFHMIITNPPYLTDSWYENTADQVKREPYMALVGGGAQGLDIIRAIVEESPRYLESGGVLLIECDDRQNSAVVQLMEAAGFLAVDHATDLAGLRRIVWGRTRCTRN